MSKVIPFVVQPKKEWHNSMEKKERIVLSDDEKSDDSDDKSILSYSSKSSYESNASSEFDILAHLADLLPGDLVDGQKPTKKANDAHLADLRVTKKKKEKYRIFKQCYRAVVEWRAKERIRRKHHIIREFEEKVRLYDEKLRQEIEDDIEAHKIAVALEAYRTEQRIKKNSVVKVKHSTIVSMYTRELAKRDLEKRDMDFYCVNLKNWAMEGFDDVEERKREAEQQQQEKLRLAAEQAEVQRKKELLAVDAKVLAEDKALTKEINTMMVRYGMVAYAERDDMSVEENVDSILKRRSGKKKGRGGRTKGKARIRFDDDAVGVASGGGGDTDEGAAGVLRLSLRRDTDLVDIQRTLNKNRHKRSRGKTAATPFKQDLSFTGDVTTVKGVHIKEVGALSLAAEITRGACPQLETLDLRDCQVRSEGMGMLLQGAKMASLLTLREVNLRGNFIGVKGVEYLRSVCPSGIFLNLQRLDLSDNELGDRGLDSLLHIILEGHFTNVLEIHLQRNRITDIGFTKLMKIVKSVADAKCPLMERLGLEGNLVSAEAKRRLKPFPHYISV